jgi:ribose transport system permease protein
MADETVGAQAEPNARAEARDARAESTDPAAMNPETPGSHRLGPAARVGRLLARQQDVPLIVVVALMIGVVAAFHPSYLSEASLVNVSQYAAWIATMAFGMVFLLSMGEIDLSVGAIFGLAIVIAAKLMAGGMSPWIAAALTLLIGAGLGALNGVLSNLLQISTLIVTLGTLSSYTAFGLILTHDATITNLPVTNSFFAKFGGGIGVIPTAVIVCIGALIVCQIIYRFTRFGFKVRAIGSNRDAARVAGISVERVRLQALIMQGFLCALIGVTVLANIEAADPTSGNGYELSVIAAAIIGGTALSGGSGTVIGALVGSLIIGVITTGLIEFGLSSDWGNFATGVVIISAVALDRWIKASRLRIAEGAGQRALRAAIGAPSTVKKTASVERSGPDPEVSSNSSNAGRSTHAS